METTANKYRDYVDALPADCVPIPGYPKRFASPDGCIFSAYGRIKRRRFSRNSCGYLTCGMRDESGKLRWSLVHRIIAKLFVKGDNTLEVNHIDMNKENCRADNLEWVKKSQNHRKLHALRPDLGKATAGRVSVALVATNADTGEKHAFASGKDAALWVGNAHAAGNISKACEHGRAAYGFYWEKA